MKDLLYIAVEALPTDLPIVFKIPSNDFAYEKNEEGKAVFLVAALKEFFRSKYDKELCYDDGQIILGTIFSELLKNAAEHGNNFDSKKYVTIEIWFGAKGIVFAFQDEGDYFSLPETKEKFESRTRIDSTSKRSPEKIRGAGIEDLFAFVELIFVSNEENKLYVGYEFKN